MLRTVCLIDERDIRFKILNLIYVVILSEDVGARLSLYFKQERQERTVEKTLDSSRPRLRHQIPIHHEF